MPKVLVVFYGYTREESSSMGEALLASVFWYYRKKMGCKLVLVMETRMYNQSSGFGSPSPQLHYGHFHFYKCSHFNTNSKQGFYQFPPKSLRYYFNFFWVNDVRITIHYAHARFDSNTTERLEYTMRIYSPNYKYKCYARSKII